MLDDYFEDIWAQTIYYNIFNNYVVNEEYFYISHKSKINDVYYKMHVENTNEKNTKNDIIKSIIKEKNLHLFSNSKTKINEKDILKLYKTMYKGLTIKINKQFKNYTRTYIITLYYNKKMELK